MPFVHPEPATPKQRKRRAYNVEHPVRVALRELAFALVVVTVPSLLFSNDAWWVPLATAGTIWALGVAMLALVVRNDRASAWYAEWKAERQGVV